MFGTETRISFRIFRQWDWIEKFNKLLGIGNKFKIQKERKFTFRAAITVNSNYTSVNLSVFPFLPLNTSINLQNLTSTKLQLPATDSFENIGNESLVAVNRKIKTQQKNQ